VVAAGDPGRPAEIPIGPTGTILRGPHRRPHVGWKIRVERVVGGCRILYIRLDGEGRQVEEYDGWVLEDDLAQYFREAGLEVVWPDEGA
jgi:hypothetical protein